MQQIEGAARLTPDRLVIISDRSRPIGGAEVIALASAQEMRAAGLSVTFITGDDAADCPLDPSKIRIIALGAGAPEDGPLLTNTARALFNVSAWRVLRDYIRRTDTPRTVYHLHNWTKIFSPSAFLALKAVSSKLFISAHDFALVCPNLSFTNFQDADATCPHTPLGTACLLTQCDRHSYLRKLWRVTRSFELRAIFDVAASGARVGVIHPDMMRLLVRGGIPEAALRVVRNPVRPYSAERIAAERNSEVFFIGRLSYEKGPDIAAEAARLAGRRIRFIGDGEMRPELQARFPEASFEGWRTHAQISALVRRARAVLVPSRMPETFTLVAHEAMRSGLPVIAFEDVDCREAAALGAAAVVPPRAPAGLAAAIRRLDDDDAVKRMSRLAFREAAQFSNTALTWREALLGHYSELLYRAASAPRARDAATFVTSRRLRAAPTG